MNSSVKEDDEVFEILMGEGHASDDMEEGFRKVYSNSTKIYTASEIHHSGGYNQSNSVSSDDVQSLELKMEEDLGEHYEDDEDDIADSYGQEENGSDFEDEDSDKDGSEEYESNDNIFEDETNQITLNSAIGESEQHEHIVEHRQDGLKDIPQMNQLYALRRGKSSSLAIFFRWSDLYAQVEGYDDAEYDIFDSIENATNYIFEHISNSNDISGKQKAGSDHVQEKANHDDWQVYFEELQRYKSQNGHVNVPLKEGLLGQWVSKQRLNYKHLCSIENQLHRKLCMDEEKKNKLLSVGFNFDTGKKNFFDNRLKEYTMWRNINGLLEPEKKSVLGDWMKIMRNRYKRYMEKINLGDTNPRISGIDSEKIRRMNMADFRWEISSLSFEQEYPFYLFLEKLRKYKEDTNGSLNPPAEIDLGKWCKGIRSFYRKFKKGEVVKEIDENKISLLDELGFNWNGKSRKSSPSTCQISRKPDAKEKKSMEWEDKFEKLQQYRNNFGSCVVIKDGSKDLTTLHRWVSTQRNLFKKKDEENCFLTKNRIEKLNSIGFVWNVKQASKDALDEEVFEKLFTQLKEYKLIHGNCAPKHHPYTPLVGFVKNMRDEYKKIRAGQPSKLTIEKIQRLNDLGFQWESKIKYKNSFEQRLAELTEYKRIHGTTVVPRPYPGGLGLWCSQVSLFIIMFTDNFRLMC
mmetsp:Transcript_1369/g.1959  ORF Transcript_1369/g.1959 Transcript_1369/m.1959 type:complete len:687 (+) Transcript_1369:213-2273(+)